VLEAAADQRHRLFSRSQHVNRISYRVRLCLDDGLVGQGRKRRKEGRPRHQERVDKEGFADIQSLEDVFLRNCIDQVVLPVDGADDAVSDRIEQELRGAHHSGTLVRV
ncbi:hypothetical protein L209DRAFT_666028, partial [Thermothelomyces heterothallicus CBS 203.75]